MGKGHWMTAMAAALGVSEAACHRDSSGPAAVREVPSATVSTAAAPLVSVEAPAPSSSAAQAASALAAASAAPSASVATTKAPMSAEEQQRQMIAALIANPPNDLMQASCGASSSPRIGSIGTGIGIGSLHNASCGATGQPLNPTGTGTAPTAVIQTSLTGPTITGDDRVIAAAKPRLRLCANHALAQDPSQQGKLIVSISVAASGDVSGASIVGNSGLSGESAACMSVGLRRLTFPSGAARTLTLAIVQTKQTS